VQRTAGLHAFAPAACAGRNCRVMEALRVMDAELEVVEAARRRAAAMAAGDGSALAALLHPNFKWTSHRGDSFDRASYIESNTNGQLTWTSQTFSEVDVLVVARTAVLRCVVTDQVSTDAGRATFRMPMTQTWVQLDGSWVCLAGHAGPLIEE
jgi:ketosteroid isomerase-like protein